MANTTTDGLAARVKAMLDSGKWSDLTIYCGTEVFRVHRALVCGSSPFFDAACSGKFLESKTGEIRLMDDDPDSVRRMIGWIYTQNYDDFQIDSNESESCESSEDDFCSETSQSASKTDISSRNMQRTSQKVLNNVRVYALADKYDISGLKDLAKSRIWDRSNRSLIKNNFPAIAIEIYNSTTPEDRSLRDLVLEIFNSGIEVNFTDHEWESSLRANGDLAFDILKATVSRKDLALTEKEVTLEKKELALKRKDLELKRKTDDLNNTSKTDTQKFINRKNAELHAEMRSTLTSILGGLRTSLEAAKRQQERGDLTEAVDRVLEKISDELW